MYLRKNHLRRASYPFDWLTNSVLETHSLRTRFELILSDFEDFLNAQFYAPLSRPLGQPDDPKHEYFQHTKFGIYFYHDFNFGQDFEGQWESVKAKYERRIKRFYADVSLSEKVLFVWFSHQPNIADSEVVEYSESLNQKFGKKVDLLIFENNNTYPIGSRIDEVRLSENVTKVILNTYPPNPENITMGNVRLCNEVFRGLGLIQSPAEKFSGLMNRLGVWLVRRLISIVPVRKWRRSLRVKYNLKYN